LTSNLRSQLACVSAVLLLAVLPSARGQAVSSDTPTFSTTSRLVYLDVVVLDRKGDPVTTGLSKGDFTITESKKKQRIFSFEPPEAHFPEKTSADENGLPATIIVLDLLNSTFDDFAYIRFEVKKYLAQQPPRLDSPTELMVLGNDSLDMVQGFTRDKAELEEALGQVPSILPYKKMNGAFWLERLGQSIDALQQMCLQNRGIPGRKNIIWVGHGSPGFITASVPNAMVKKLYRYVHETANMLVDSRIALFVIYPGLQFGGPGRTWNEMAAGIDLGDSDPFAGDINFGTFVNETGGKLFYNRNDIDSEMKRVQKLGSQYYTLTYQPQIGEEDGKFRRVRVSVRNPNLRVLTKAGYFAPDKTFGESPQLQTMNNMVEALRSTIPFPGIRVTAVNLVRHPDTRTVECTVAVQSDHLQWQTVDAGKSTTAFTMAAASLGKNGRILASRVEQIGLSANTEDLKRTPETLAPVRIMLRMPKATDYVRVAVIENGAGGRLGSIKLDRKLLTSAPETPTPQRQLIPRASS